MNSMTAFSRFAAQTSSLDWVWEIKSVNHRYLDQFYRLPELCRRLEPRLRPNVAQYLQRGRIEISLQLIDQRQTCVEFNSSLLAVYRNMANKLALEQNIENDLKMSHYMSRTELFRQITQDITDTDEQEILASFTSALEALLKVRQLEGANLAKLMEIKVDKLQACLSQIQMLSVETVQSTRDKLNAKMEKFYLGQYDEQRFEQELMYQLMRIDITEEVDRLSTHIQEFKRVMATELYCGRRLDFLVQECHRETNTMGAKTDSDQISQMIIEMKVIIEQLREQIQNVE